MYNIYVWHSDLVTLHSTAGSDNNNFHLRGTETQSLQLDPGVEVGLYKQQ